MTDVRERFVAEDGTPRLERVLPVAMVAVGVIGLIAVTARRRKG